MFYVDNLGFCNAKMIMSCEMYNKINPSFFILHCRQGGKKMEVKMSKIWFAWIQIGNSSEDILCILVAMF